MVQRRTQVRRAAARPHMESANGEACFQTRLRQAAHVARFARALQAVRQDDLTARRTGRPLLLHQDLHARLCLVELGFHREALDVEPARPEVSDRGEDVIVGYDRTEGPQAYILA